MSFFLGANSVLRILLGGLLATFLVACGGSGGGDNNDNFEGPTGETPNFNLGQLELYSLGFSTTEATLLLGRVAADAYLASEQNGFDAREGDCDGTGQRTVTFTDMDASAGASEGDVLQLSYTNCAQPIFSGVVNGSINLTIQEVSGAAAPYDRATRFAVRFEGFRITELAHDTRVNGGFILDYRDAGSSGDEIELRLTEESFGYAFSNDIRVELQSGSNFKKAFDFDASKYDFSFDATFRAYTAGQNFELQMDTLGDIPDQPGLFEGGFADFPTLGAARFFIPRVGSQCTFAPGSDGGGAAKPSTPAISVSSGDAGCNTVRNPNLLVSWSQMVTGTLFAASDPFHLREGDSGTPFESDQGSDSDDPGTGVETPNPADIQAKVADLPAEGFDLAEDTIRNQLYVSLPSLNQIAVVAKESLTVTDRIAVGSKPSGIDLSSDGGTLYIALNGAGAVAYLDIETRQVRQVAIQEALDDPRAWDVVEARPGEIFVSGNPGSNGLAYIVKVNRNTGDTITRVADEEIIRARPEFAVDEDQEFLYVGSGFSPNSLYKLDLTNSEAPIVREDDHGSVSGTDRLALFADGDQILLASGQVLRTSDFTQSAQITSGLPTTNAAGDRLYVAGYESAYQSGWLQLSTFETDTYIETQTKTNDCPVDELKRFGMRANYQAFYILGSSALCEIPKQ